MINFKLDRVDRSVNKVSSASDAEVLDLFNASEIRSKKMKIRADIESCILKSGQHVFADNGLCRSSRQMISDDASIANSNSHYYLSSNEKLHRCVVERIFTVRLEAEDSFEILNELRATLHDYLNEKTEIGRFYPDGSKVWDNEVIHDVSIMDDFLTSALEAWTNSRIKAMRRLIRQGKIRGLEPRRMLYVIWVASQPYADFAHPIETLNDGTALSINQWQQARDTVFDIFWTELEPKD